MTTPTIIETARFYAAQHLAVRRMLDNTGGHYSELQMALLTRYTELVISLLTHAWNQAEHWETGVEDLLKAARQYPTSTDFTPFVYDDGLVRHLKDTETLLQLAFGFDLPIMDDHPAFLQLLLKKLIARGKVLLEHPPSECDNHRKWRAALEYLVYNTSFDHTDANDLRGRINLLNLLIENPIGTQT